MVLTHNNRKKNWKTIDTLSANQNERNVLDISILGHLGVVIVDGIEARLVLETEHEDDRVDPRSELKQNETGRKNNGHKIEKCL